MSEIQLTDDSFDKEVVQSDAPVLVDFWAPWCGPCRMLSPVIEELSKEYTGKVKVAGKKRKVGFYSAVGCKGGKRSIQVTFVSETGQKSPVSKDVKC